ncbi:hypothetical protein BD324DRAFT_632328 [Kockovaella imperatae]|uniref:C2H2-type domain-containing protein n=1 Tax=Kockovaella imperatae TaxID=4999 RepID=A0A1Y1UBA0_9TREE|nr:hypothetical protein BD324DRAFT_632328 [Kockovaella imperatae]ORX35320.1 hypothetical protein BD324DRAFT_632328 [Kockovaella imperatae]
MAESKPAVASSSRKQWDKSEWEAKAKAKDEQSVEAAKAADAAIKQGKKPRFNIEDLPKPTKALEARTEDLGLEKNLNKTMLVQTSTTGRGPKGAGYYCELCNRTFQDSLSYLDHVNGRFHLRRMGQTTQAARSTLTQVREKIRQLRESTAVKVTAKNYDFSKRLAEVRQVEMDEKQRRKEERKRKREERREEQELGKMGIIKRSKVDEVAPIGQAGKSKSKSKANGDKGGPGDREDKEVLQAKQQHDDMAAMMGFGGFGGGRKKK